MSKQAWECVFDDLLGNRTVQPRQNGVTMVIDKGYGMEAVKDVVETADKYIDHWKCGFGTSALASEEMLRQKLTYLAEHGILAYPGGTLFEIGMLHRKASAFIEHACALGFGAVEISDGTISLTPHDRHDAIRMVRDNGIIPITEVGKKDVSQQLSVAELADQIVQDLEWGASWVIVEARESGKGVGIYDAAGTVNTQMIDELCSRLGSHLARVLWEAPLKDQQCYFIHQFGPNVNLGNIHPQEILSLETLRMGLRFDTLSPLVDQYERSAQEVSTDEESSSWSETLSAYQAGRKQIHQPESLSSSRQHHFKQKPTSVLGVGARLIAEPAPELVTTAFARELAEQEMLFCGMNQADIAHAVVQIEAGLIPKSEGNELLSALLTLHTYPASFIPRAELGDLYTNREAWIAARTKTVGWLGAGRARRESTTIGYQICVRDKLIDLAVALLEIGKTLMIRVEEYRDTLMSDYTYLQAAQPTTFGHYLLTFAFPLLRDLDRLRSLYERINKSPAGCGSVNGSRLPQDRIRLAEILGFDGLVYHTRDAMWQPDEPIEILALLVAMLVNFDRLAEDLQIFSTAEFDLVELADSYTRASVIMPQKKNPYALSYIRGITNELTGMLTMSATFGRTPSGQVDNRLFIYGMVPKALDSATGAVTLLEGVLRSLRFNSDVAQKRLQAGFAWATDFAEMMTLECKLDFRSAHRIAAILVRNAVAEHCEPNKLTLQHLDIAAVEAIGRTIPLSEAIFAQALDPGQAVRARHAPGGAAPAQIDAMVAHCRSLFETHTHWYLNMRESTTRASYELIRRAHTLSGDC